MLVYVKNQFVKMLLLWNLHSFDDNLEFLPISFTFCNHRFCIATFCQPPSSFSSYFENLQFAVQQLDIVNFYSFALIGDFNIDYFSTSHFCIPSSKTSWIAFVSLRWLQSLQILPPMAFSH